MSTKTERAVAHDEKLFIFRPEIAYGRPTNVVGFFFLKNLLNRPKTYKTVFERQFPYRVKLKTTLNSDDLQGQTPL